MVASQDSGDKEYIFLKVVLSDVDDDNDDDEYLMNIITMSRSYIHTKLIIY